jgi:hypothetical protein
MIALNERLPDGYKLLPPAGRPGRGEGRRRSLRQVVADRRAARASRHPDGPASGLAESLADRQHQADLHADRAQAGTVGERRVAEALRPGRRARPGRRPPGPRPTGRAGATGKTRSVTASLRTTSAITGIPTVSAPTTSAEPTAGGCRSRRRGPGLGCRWAATTTRSATATVRTADLGCSTPQPSPGPVVRARSDGGAGVGR